MDACAIDKGCGRPLVKCWAIGLSPREAAGQGISESDRFRDYHAAGGKTPRPQVMNSLKMASLTPAQCVLRIEMAALSIISAGRTEYK